MNEPAMGRPRPFLIPLSCFPIERFVLENRAICGAGQAAMNILSAQGLAKAHGLKRIFEGLSFGIDERDRIGVIGVNGSGKSTLLRMLAGWSRTTPARWPCARTCASSTCRRHPVFDADQTVLEHVFSAAGEADRLVRDYETALPPRWRATPSDAALLRRLRRTVAPHGRRRRPGTYETARQDDPDPARRRGFRGARSARSPAATASGWPWPRRCSPSPDLLLLDEPTNHLDADTVAWLEEYLAALQRRADAGHPRPLLPRPRHAAHHRARPRRAARLRRQLLLLPGARKPRSRPPSAAAENRRRAILQQGTGVVPARRARARAPRKRPASSTSRNCKAQAFEPRDATQLEFETGDAAPGQEDRRDLNGIAKSLGEPDADRRFHLHLHARRAAGRHRPQRLRQDDAGQPDHRPPRARRRHDRGRRDGRLRLLTTRKARGWTWPSAPSITSSARGAKCCARPTARSCRPRP